MSFDTIGSLSLVRLGRSGPSPTLDGGQVVRTASLCILVLLALALSIRGSDAAKVEARSHHIGAATTAF